MRFCSSSTARAVVATSGGFRCTWLGSASGGTEGVGARRDEKLKESYMIGARHLFSAGALSVWGLYTVAKKVEKERNGTLLRCCCFRTHASLKIEIIADTGY